MALQILAERIDPRADANYLDETHVYLPFRGSPILCVPRKGGVPDRVRGRQRGRRPA